MISSGSIDLSGMLATIGAIEARVNNPAPFYRVATAWAVSLVKGRFDSSSGPDGIPWVPLAHSRPLGGNKPLLNKGILRNSITGTYSGDTITVGTVWGSANLMNFGGAVVPQKAKFLSIPVTREAERAGSPTRFKRPLSCFIFPSRTAGILYELTGRRRNRVVHYYLTKSVNIPGRPFIGWGQNDLAILKQMYVDYLTH